MITIKDYVEELFKDIPKSEEKDNIKNEIILNLEEKVQDLMEDGKAEEDAINKSIVEFGDINEIRRELIKLSDVKPRDSKKKKINYSNRFWFAFCGSALTIAFLYLVNYITTPHYVDFREHLWFIYPTFAILWWPLAMLFSWLNNKGK